MKIVFVVTYIPRYFASYSFELSFFADPIKRFQSCSIQRSLKVHILNVEVNVFASFYTFDSEVEPSPKEF